MAATDSTRTPEPSGELASALRDLLHQVEHQDAPEFTVGRAWAALRAFDNAPTPKTLCGGIYTLNPAATGVALADALSERLHHLRALLHVSYDVTGDGGFSSHPEETRNDYLWATTAMADECLELWRRLSVRACQEREFLTRRAAA